MNQRRKRLCAQCGRPHWRSISVVCVDCGPASNRKPCRLRLPEGVIAERIQRLQALDAQRRPLFPGTRVRGERDES